MKRRLLLLALFVAVALLTRAPFLRVPCLDLDEAAQLLGAQALLRGGTPYLDVADNRPPLLYAWYALGQALLGAGLPGVRLLTAALVLPLTAFAASAFYRHDGRGASAGLLYLVYGAAFLAHDMHSASPEVLMTLPVAAAVVLLREEAEARVAWRLAAAGALVGFGVLLRQQAALALPALAFAAWTAPPADAPPLPRRAGLPLRLVALGLGFSVPLALGWAWFAARGAAGALLFWTLVHNLRYAANPIPAGEALERAASYLAPFLLVTAPLWWAAARSRGRFGSPHRERLVLALLACSLPSAFVGLRFFPHYFVQLYLPLALAAAPWTAEALASPASRAGRLAAAWALVALAGFTAANAWLYSGRAHVYQETAPVFGHVAGRLRQDPCYGSGPLFVWGFAPQLYVESGLSPASRFVVPQASLTGYVPGNRASRAQDFDARSLVREEHWELLMQDLARRPPAFVLDTAPAGLHGWSRYPLRDFPRLAAFVKGGYDAVAIVDGVWVWRRRGCAATAARPAPSG
ncbi:MAG: hypothetical protein ACM3PV_08245 [Betaproteobacteria bacterium]